MSKKSSKNMAERKMERKAQHRRMKREEQVRRVVGISMLIFLGSLLAVIVIHPELGLLRGVVNILFRVLLCAATCFVTWRFFTEDAIVTRIVASAISALLFLPLFPVGGRVLLTVNTVAFWLLLGYMGYLLLFRGTHCMILNLEAVCLVMYLLREAGNYTFVDRPGSIHFWQIVLAISLTAAVVAFVLLRTEKIVIESKRALGPSGSAVVVFFCAWISVWTTVYHLNYLLDFSTPTEYTAVIQSKEYNSGARRPTTYSFVVELDGERIEVSVSESDSRTYQVGNRYPIKRYEGAFRHAYYISGNR